MTSHASPVFSFRFTRSGAGYAVGYLPTLDSIAAGLATSEEGRHLGRVVKIDGAWQAIVPSGTALGEQYPTRAEAATALRVTADAVARVEAIADAADPAEGEEVVPATVVEQDAPRQDLDGEFRETAHGLRYLTADEVAAEQAAVEAPAAPVSYRKVGEGLYEVVLDGRAVGRVARTTPAHVTFGARWASYSTTGERIASGLTSRENAGRVLTGRVVVEPVAVKPATVVVELPPRFYADHVERDLPGGTVVECSARRVVVELDAEAFDDLLDDARHYAAGADAGFDPREFAGLIASARTTVARLEGVARPAAPVVEEPARVAHLMDGDLLAACGSSGDPAGLLVVPSSTPERITCRRCILAAVEEETRRLGYGSAAGYLQAAGREQLCARVEVAAYAPDGAPIPVDAIVCDCPAVPGPHLAHCDDCSAPADGCVCDEPAVDDDPREQPAPLEWSEHAGA